MMAKMFYTADETRQMLGKDEEELKQLTREGKLREFRDGPRVMYKADQVETLKAELGMGGLEAVDVGPSDSGGPIGLSDTRGGASVSGSVIALADTTAGKGDTATDMGLSPSNTGIAPSPANTGSGVAVLGLDEGGSADPSAQTAVSSSFSGDNINVEAMGSGSGLLDLSRERDDTSLGTPVFDQIKGGGSETGSAINSGPMSVGGVSASAVSAVAASRGMPMYVEAPDALSSALGGASIGAAAFALLAIFAIACNAVGMELPTFLSQGDGPARSALPWFYLLGAGAALSLVGFVLGLVMGKKR
jgi:hypothetical protein